MRGETQDILFVEYATNLRGFDYATLFGNSVMLFNAEFRVPLIRALTNVRPSHLLDRKLFDFAGLLTSKADQPDTLG